MTKENLQNTIMGELQEQLGREVVIRDIDEKDKSSWKSSALPLTGQEGPILGLRVFKYAAICSLCPKEAPYCTLSETSMDSHRSRTKVSSHIRAKGKKYFVAPVQTMSVARGLCQFFPVPHSNLVDPDVARVAVAVPLDTGNDGDDSDDDVAKIIQRDKRKLMGPATESKPGIFDIKTLVPFYRDHGVHEFLKKYQPDKVSALLQIPDRRSEYASLPLRRLYAIVIETFLADCVMAVKMNPAIRRLIAQSDPYVLSVDVLALPSLRPCDFV